jgi:hypothetical protein
MVIDVQTKYGLVDGLCGVNCRHSFAPFFPDIQEGDIILAHYFEKVYTAY